MIQANELRVGNYIGTIYKDFNTQRITEINQSHVNTENINGLSYRSLVPIKITEEMLLECGFILFGQGYIHETMRYNDLFKIREDGYIVYVVKDNYITKLKHLHELQNLYYALTNQELETKF